MKGTGDFRRLVLLDEGVDEVVELLDLFTCDGYFVKRRGRRDPFHVREEDLSPLPDDDPHHLPPPLKKGVR